MLTVEEYRSGFLSYLESFKSPTNPKNLYEPVSYILGLKGKRIRPILTLLTCDIFNDNHKSALDAALAVEVFHNFSLVHDDIMDEDDLRHNVATIHKKWDNAHAVLSGDGLGALGPLYIGKIKKNTLAILIRYNEVILEICEGPVSYTHLTLPTTCCV